MAGPRLTCPMIIPILFLTFLPGVITGAPPSPPYASVTSLNKYGQSEQLRNAMLASSLYGTLTVAALATDSAVVCSLYRPRPGVKPAFGHPSIKTGPAVHCIAGDDRGDDDSHSDGASFTVLVCSGVKADARLLLKMVRENARRFWERYDSIPGCERVASALSEALLSFMRYDRGRELHDGTGPVVDEDFDMARPFGVQSLVIGIRPGDAVKMRSVDPSGVQAEWAARALGKGSDEANVMLAKLWKSGLSKEEVGEICTKIIREVHREEAQDGNLNMDEAEVICETISADGVQIVRFPFKSEIEESG